MSATTKQRWSAEELIAEVEFLGLSDGPESIARRLGYSSARSLARALQKAGRHDLASRFERERKWQAAS